VQLFTDDPYDLSNDLTKLKQNVDVVAHCNSTDYKITEP